MVHTYHYNTIQEAYKQIVEDLKASPIVNNTHEINNCFFVVENPTLDNYYLPYRNLSEKYLTEELKWYWSGDNRCETIGQHAKMWLSLTDDGVTNNSAYGYILRYKYNKDQIQEVINILKKDPYSRRGIINISDPTLNKQTTKDLQCTVCLEFMIRNNKLDVTVVMRSNDIYFGLPYDYYYFVSLQYYIASQLNVEVGHYNHLSISMHMYLRDEEKFKKYDVNPINIDIQGIIKEYYEK